MFDTRKPAPIEARMSNADGPRWVRTLVRVQHDALGRARKAIGLVQDIDAQKRQAIALEQAERASLAAEAEANFLANVSHEIRTPMNGVLGVLQLISVITSTPRSRSCWTRRWPPGAC
jgi:signal transduction histidine kinase